MREAVADLFELHAGGTPIAVTTSGALDRHGRALLGPGSARECGRRFPWFAEQLGALVAAQGLCAVHVGEGLVALPVERTPFENPDPELIARSARELVALVDGVGWREFCLPRPGCGHGGLEWEALAPRLASILDDRFLVVRRAHEPALRG